MFVTFIESAKYVGHLFPVAFLRMYMGYHFLSVGFKHTDSGFLTLPQLSGMIQQHLPSSSAPEWMVAFMESVVVPNWSVFSYLLTYSEFIIGIAMLLGFLVRPISLVAIVYCYCFMFISDLGMSALYQVLMVLFFILAWIGAGRSFGMDYYFFKRHRGVWW